MGVAHLGFLFFKKAFMVPIASKRVGYFVFKSASKVHFENFTAEVIILSSYPPGGLDMAQ